MISDRKAHDQYHNPDGIPDKVLNAGPNRKIIMSFASQEDLDKFFVKTGIRFTPKTTYYKFDPNTSLDKFFG